MNEFEILYKSSIVVAENDEPVLPSYCRVAMVTVILNDTLTTFFIFFILQKQQELRNAIDDNFLSSYLNISKQSVEPLN